MSDLIRALDLIQATNAARIAAETPLPNPKDLDSAERSLLANFAKWCGANGVSDCPAAPIAIAAWIRSERAIGIESERIMATLVAIAKLHDARGLANPICTHAVRSSLDFTNMETAPPSWKKEQRYLWAILPPDVRMVISKRDHQARAEVRRAQNEAADLRHEVEKLKSLQQKEVTDGKEVQSS